MKSLSNLRPTLGLVVVTAGIAVLSGFYGSEATLRSESRIDGRSRLIAVEQLPDASGAMCELPANLTAGAPVNPALAALSQQAASNRAAAEDARRAEVAKRKPLRVIQDQYALFSAVAVDAVRDEAVLTDENLFTIHVYDRTTN